MPLVEPPCRSYQEITVGKADVNNDYRADRFYVTEYDGHRGAFIWLEIQADEYSKASASIIGGQIKGSDGYILGEHEDGLLHYGLDANANGAFRPRVDNRRIPFFAKPDGARFRIGDRVEWISDDTRHADYIDGFEMTVRHTKDPFGDNDGFRLVGISAQIYAGGKHHTVPLPDLILDRSVLDIYDRADTLTDGIRDDYNRYMKMRSELSDRCSDLELRKNVRLLEWEIKGALAKGIEDLKLDREGERTLRHILLENLGFTGINIPDTEMYALVNRVTKTVLSKDEAARNALAALNRLFKGTADKRCKCADLRQAGHLTAAIRKPLEAEVKAMGHEDWDADMIVGWALYNLNIDEVLDSTIVASR